MKKIVESTEFERPRKVRRKESPLSNEQSLLASLKKMSILRIIGSLLVVMIVLALGVSMFNGLSNNAYRLTGGIMPSSFGEAEGVYNNLSDSVSKSVYNYDVAEMNQAVRLPTTDVQGYETGNDAEAMEITEHSGTINSNNLQETCSTLFDLKKYPYVIFEDSSIEDTSCYAIFKVENDYANDVLGLIKDLDPTNLISKTHTVKATIEHYTTEVEILENKLAMVETILAEGQESYDELRLQVDNVKDINGLANIINNKIALIERLTNERFNIKQRIDSYNTTKAEYLDKLDYTFFRINVYEDIVVDFQRIKDSWESKLENFIWEFNSILQEGTFDIVNFLMKALVMLLYLFFMLIIVKFGWKSAKYIWKR